MSINSFGKRRYLCLIFVNLIWSDKWNKWKYKIIIHSTHHARYRPFSLWIIWIECLKGLSPRWLRRPGCTLSVQVFLLAYFNLKSVSGWGCVLIHYCIQIFGLYLNWRQPPVFVEVDWVVRVCGLFVNDHFVYAIIHFIQIHLILNDYETRTWMHWFFIVDYSFVYIVIFVWPQWNQRLSQDRLENWLRF